MSKIIYVGLILVGALLFFSCKNTGDQSVTKNKTVQNKILQQPDGTISLKVEKADL